MLLVTEVPYTLWSQSWKSVALILFLLVFPWSTKLYKPIQNTIAICVQGEILCVSARKVNIKTGKYI